MDMEKNTANKTFRIGEELYRCDTPMIMGIVNLTPDSFFAGSRSQAPRDIQKKVEQHLLDGADILDFGAYSTRPGAMDVTVDEELYRFQMAAGVIDSFDGQVPFSVDTFRAETVRRLYDMVGPFIVNDISGGQIDPDMFRTVAELRLPYIGMHMRGTPQTMMDDTHYGSLIDECIQYFARMVEDLKALGVADIFIDPGFGFSKTLEQNYELLAQLDRFAVLQRPVVVGLSRKSMIYKLLATQPENALNGTTALHTVALLKGADILRVHDAKEAAETLRLVRQLGL